MPVVARYPGLLCLSLVRLCLASYELSKHKSSSTHTSANRWVKRHRRLFLPRRLTAQLQRLRQTKRCSSTAMFLCVIVISGDIQFNSGPTTRSRAAGVCCSSVLMANSFWLAETNSASANYHLKGWALLISRY